MSILVFVLHSQGAWGWFSQVFVFTSTDPYKRQMIPGVRGSMSHAEAMLVRDPPQTTIS